MKNSKDIVIAIMGIALLYLLVDKLKKSQPVAGLLPPAGTYKNNEVWSVKWDENMLPTEIIVKRDAKRE